MMMSSSNSLSLKSSVQHCDSIEDANAFIVCYESETSTNFVIKSTDKNFHKNLNGRYYQGLIGIIKLIL